MNKNLYEPGHDQTPDHRRHADHHRDRLLDRDARPGRPPARGDAVRNCRRLQSGDKSVTTTPDERRTSPRRPDRRDPSYFRIAAAGPTLVRGCCCAWRARKPRRFSAGAPQGANAAAEIRPPQAVPPTVSPSMRSVGWPTPTGTLCLSLPQVPTPGSRRMSLPIIFARFSTSGPLPIRVAPLTGRVTFAVLDQVGLGGREHELARGDVHLPATEVHRIQALLDRLDDLLRVLLSPSSM